MEFIYFSISQILAAFAMRHSCNTNGNFNFIQFQLLKLRKLGMQTLVWKKYLRNTQMNSFFAVEMQSIADPNISSLPMAFWYIF